MITGNPAVNLSLKQYKDEEAIKPILDEFLQLGVFS
jgi:hypothetical protein